MPPPPGTLEIRGSWVQCGLLDNPPSPSCMFTDLSSNPERAQSEEMWRWSAPGLSFPAQNLVLFALPANYPPFPPFSARLPKNLHLPVRFVPSHPSTGCKLALGCTPPTSESAPTLGTSNLPVAKSSEPFLVLSSLMSDELLFLPMATALLYGPSFSSSGTS